MSGSVSYAKTTNTAVNPILHKIHHYVRQQHKWAYWSYRPEIKYRNYAEHTKSLVYRKWIQHEWRLRANRAYAYYQWLGRLDPAFACIHSKEGSWTANTGNGYYGGVQANHGFEDAYNPRAERAYGNANNWPPRDQLVMAHRGYAKRGYTPWPNTARMCGLL